MAQVTDSGQQRTSGWAVGGTVFAGVMLAVIGAFDFIVGLVALMEDDFYVVTDNYIIDADASSWGWWHLIFGVLLVAVGLAILVGQTWARVVGIALAGINAIANFLFIPYYPIWSLLIIALDVFVIWALATYRDDERTAA